jgi:hypothetical protein
LSDYKCYCGLFTPFSGKMKKSIKIFSYPEIVDKNLGFIQKKRDLKRIGHFWSNNKRVVDSKQISLA